MVPILVILNFSWRKRLLLVSMMKQQQMSEAPAKNGVYGTQDTEEWVYNHAIATMEMTETPSQTMTQNPSVKAAPFSPTICSVDRFVSSSDPAIRGNVSERPARK